MVLIALAIHVAILLSIPVHWPVYRIVIALMANLIAFMITGLYLVTHFSAWP